MSAPTFVTVSAAPLHQNLASQMSADAMKIEFVYNVQKMLQEVKEVFDRVRKEIRADTLFGYINLKIIESEIQTMISLFFFYTA